jgi:hypothetical protein
VESGEEEDEEGTVDEDEDFAELTNLTQGALLE